jgi:hypothetical protein
LLGSHISPYGALIQVTRRKFSGGCGSVSPGLRGVLSVVDANSDELAGPLHRRFEPDIAQPQPGRAVCQSLPRRIEGRLAGAQEGAHFLWEVGHCSRQIDDLAVVHQANPRPPCLCKGGQLHRSPPCW